MASGADTEQLAVQLGGVAMDGSKDQAWLAVHSLTSQLNLRPFGTHRSR